MKRAVSHCDEPGSRLGLDTMSHCYANTESII